MLNKRIKSLLVAGLVILGMGFAKVDSFAAETLTSKITDIEFVEGETQKVIKLQQDYIIVTINRNADGKYDIIVKYDKTMVNVIGIDSIGELGSVYSNFNTCYDVKEEGDNIIVTIKGVNENPSLGELTKVNVYFTLVDSDGDGVPDIKDDTPNGDDDDDDDDDDDEKPEPKDPNVDDPETGDASIMPIVVTAVASAAGLYVLNKKDDEE